MQISHFKAQNFFSPLNETKKKKNRNLKSVKESFTL